MTASTGVSKDIKFYLEASPSPKFKFSWIFKKASVLSSTKFHVGQKVMFGRTNSGLQRVGVIQKMNPAKAIIQVYDNATKNLNNWRVPYSRMKAGA